MSNGDVVRAGLEGTSPFERFGVFMVTGCPALMASDIDGALFLGIDDGAYQHRPLRDRSRPCRYGR